MVTGERTANINSNKSHNHCWIYKHGEAGRLEKEEQHRTNLIAVDGRPTVVAQVTHACERNSNSTHTDSTQMGGPCFAILHAHASQRVKANTQVAASPCLPSLSTSDWQGPPTKGGHAAKPRGGSDTKGCFECDGACTSSRQRAKVTQGLQKMLIRSHLRLAPT